MIVLGMNYGMVYFFGCEIGVDYMRLDYIVEIVNGRLFFLLWWFGC